MNQSLLTGAQALNTNTSAPIAPACGACKTCAPFIRCIRAQFRQHGSAILTIVNILLNVIVLSVALTTMQTKIDNMQGQLNALQPQVDTVTNKLQGFEKIVNDLDAELPPLATLVDNLNHTVHALNLDTLADTVTSLRQVEVALRKDVNASSSLLVMMNNAVIDAIATVGTAETNCSLWIAKVNNQLHNFSQGLVNELD